MILRGYDTDNLLIFNITFARTMKFNSYVLARFRRID